MKIIDLSCDLGEATTAEEEAIEESLWPLVSSANVACGGHVGDEATMRRAVERAARYNVKLGAHPSYPDRQHFGRAAMQIEHAALVDALAAQLHALRDAAQRAGLRLAHAKAHGALYNISHRDDDAARAVVEAVLNVDRSIAIVCAPGSAVVAIAETAGVAVTREAFADRRYLATGELVPRSESRSLLLAIDEAVSQARLLATESSVRASDGSRVDITFDTLCLHGDMENAVVRVAAVRQMLEATGFSVSSAARNRVTR